MKSKSQIKSLETIAVLIIFFFLLSFGFSFYGRFKALDLEEKKEHLKELEAIKLSNTLYFLPELQCPPSLEKDSCFDTYKIDSSIDTISKNKDFYTSKFGYSIIKIQKIFPQGDDVIIYNNTAGEEKIEIYTPISLYNPITKESAFAVLIVTKYY